jgi:hypothetical protein
VKLSQWRTVGVACLGIVALVGGLALTGVWPAASGSYGAFVSGVGVCVGAVAAKAFGQHAANAKAGQK